MFSSYNTAFQFYLEHFKPCIHKCWALKFTSNMVNLPVGHAFLWKLNMGTSHDHNLLGVWSQLLFPHFFTWHILLRWLSNERKFRIPNTRCSINKWEIVIITISLWNFLGAISCLYAPCAHVWRPEADSRCLSSIVFHLYFLKHGLSLNLKLTDSTRLDSQWAAGICLFLLH